jgi:hypothetical protein
MQMRMKLMPFNETIKAGADGNIRSWDHKGEYVADAIELSSDIPVDAKRAVKDTVKELWGDIVDAMEQGQDALLELFSSSEVAEYSVELVRIIIHIFG